MDNNKTSIQNRINELKGDFDFDVSLKSKVELFTANLYDMLFNINSSLDIISLEKQFNELLEIDKKTERHFWENYCALLPSILETLKKDANTYINTDPAANSIQEVYIAYPGFYAITIYRLSHPLYKMGLKLIARIMTEYAHSKTGADINPGATIGSSFFIDHATGVVIGETAEIKENVRLYQGVTLGGKFVDRNLKNTKRHPTVESNVTIYANATILGGDTIIGENSIIGGNTWITASIPKNSVVSNDFTVKIKH